MNEYSQFCTVTNNKLFNSLDVKSAAPIHKNKTTNARWQPIHKFHIWFSLHTSVMVLHMSKYNLILHRQLQATLQHERTEQCFNAAAEEAEGVQNILQTCMQY